MKKTASRKFSPIRSARFGIIAIFFMTTILQAQKIASSGTAMHVVALKSNGAVYDWGYNSVGQLGNSSIVQSNVPVAVDVTGVLSGKTITAIGAGMYHTLAIASDGTAYAWGNNGAGQLGNNNYPTNSTIPVAVSMGGALSGKTVTQITGGTYHSVAIANGNVYTWGDNSEGELGLGGDFGGYVAVPNAVSTSGVLSGLTVTAITAGFNFTAVIANGAVYTWGYNTDGELGNNSTTRSTAPVAVYTGGVLSGKTITAIAAGNTHTVAVASDGTVYAWGDNTYGQLGNNSTSGSLVPVAVVMSGALSGKTIKAVAAGYGHTVALATDGTVYAWGFNYEGELGTGSAGGTSLVPVAVKMNGALAGKTVTAICVGYECSAALASDGTVFGWGYNNSGQIGNNTTTDRYEPTATTLTSMGALPVELVSFTATAKSGSVTLQWATATESNNAGFDVEKSETINGNNTTWVKAGFVAGHGTTNAPQRYSFTDTPENGTYSYRLKQIDRDGKFEYSGVVTVSTGTPASYELRQNYPNPFNPATTIAYKLPADGFVSIKIFDVAGREVVSVVNEKKEAGNYVIVFDGSRLSSGVYFCRMTAPAYTSATKMIITK